MGEYPNFLNALSKVFVFTGVFGLVYISLLTGVRHLHNGALNINTCKGVDTSLLKAVDYYPFFQIPSWNVIASNDWSYIGKHDVKASFKYNNSEVMFEESYERFGLVEGDKKSSISDSRFHVLQFDERKGAVVFICGDLLNPEGRLLVLKNNNNNNNNNGDTSFHASAKGLASQLHIDVLYYVEIAHSDSSSYDFYHAVFTSIWYVYFPLLMLHILACNMIPYEVTITQSFSYTSLFSWNYGNKMFNVQNLLFTTYHQHVFARITHLTILLDVMLWYTVFASFFQYLLSPTLAIISMSGVVCFQISQLISFGDKRFMAVCAPIYLVLSTLAYTQVSPSLVLACKISIFLSAFTRMIGHATEKFPPIVSGQDYPISIPSLPLKQKLKVPFVGMLGIFSESAASLPGRGFPSILYLTMSGVFGFTSPHFISLDACAEINKVVDEKGWKGYPMLAQLTEQYKRGIFAKSIKMD